MGPEPRQRGGNNGPLQPLWTTVMPQHIGIVGCSAEGAALCYRTLCAEGAALLGRPHAHPEVTPVSYTHLTLPTNREV